MEHNCAVGIVTINDYTNYGNRLQNYALTRLLELEGFKVFNGIRVYTKEDWIVETPGRLSRLIKMFIPFALVKRKFYNVEPKIEGEMLKRKHNFTDFTKKYTTILEPITSRTRRGAYKSLKKSGIDYFISGSDQVWNPYCGGSGLEFLTFAPKRKRLSFAASIGIDEIPRGLTKYYEKNLRDMHYISVREEKAVEIVKKLTNRSAEITLDPTLLLEREEWERIIEAPKELPRQKYICTYFLGNIPEAVNIFAKQKKLPIYNLNSVDDKSLYIISPSVFLYYIKNASFVLTDSFHAVAFSIKFNKEFYVFDREQDGVKGMFSRIETITKKLTLENRIQNRSKILEQPPISHWEDIERVLQEENVESMKKLIRAM